MQNLFNPSQQPFPKFPDNIWIQCYAMKFLVYECDNAKSRCIMWSTTCMLSYVLHFVFSFQASVSCSTLQIKRWASLGYHKDGTEALEVIKWQKCLGEHPSRPLFVSFTKYLPNRHALCRCAHDLVCLDKRTHALFNCISVLSFFHWQVMGTSAKRMPLTQCHIYFIIGNPVIKS